MRTLLVAMVVLVACNGKDKHGDAAKVEQKGPTAPTVKVATVLAKDEAKPPFLYLVDNAGTITLAAAATWADLDANALKISKRAVEANSVDRFVREMYAMGRDPAGEISVWDESSEIDLESLEDTTPPSTQDDPPPPPEEEDQPDEGKDESGGTGTAMALEEGKMGQKDSDRAEGQYKMRKTTEDPMLAREQAIEQARESGILGNGTGAAVGAFGRRMPSEDGSPSRMADIAGVVMNDGKLERMRAMIVIAPTAKATTLIDIVRETESPIAVSYNGKVRPLHLQFAMRDAASVSSSSSWLEARVTMKGLVVEAVPDKPLDVAVLDQLGAAIDNARSARGMDADAPVDVLVDPDVDVQRFVDVVVALDLAGVTVIGMGKALATEELARRGHRIATLRFGQPNAQGDLPKALIRRVIKGAGMKIKSCYEKALWAEPSLSGTVMVQFFIKPDGAVATAAASGVSPDVADCVARVITALSFPKPRGGGGVQVNYPFTMRN